MCVCVFVTACLRECGAFYELYVFIFSFTVICVNCVFVCFNVCVPVYFLCCNCGLSVINKRICYVYESICLK